MDRPAGCCESVYGLMRLKWTCIDLWMGYVCGVGRVGTILPS